MLGSPGFKVCCVSVFVSEAHIWDPQHTHRCLCPNDRGCVFKISTAGGSLSCFPRHWDIHAPCTSIVLRPTILQQQEVSSSIHKTPSKTYVLFSKSCLDSCVPGPGQACAASAEGAKRPEGCLVQEGPPRGSHIQGTGIQGV